MLAFVGAFWEDEFSLLVMIYDQREQIKRGEQREGLHGERRIMRFTLRRSWLVIGRDSVVDLVAL